jgi:VanZ family protein
MFVYFIKYSKLLALIWTVFVLLLCAFPGQYIPSISWLEILSFDKWVHLTIFFILTFLWFNYFFYTGNLSLKYKIIILFLCIVYGGALEFAQSWLFSHRSTDYLDFIANSIGCVLAFFTFKPLYQLLQRV